VAHLVVGELFPQELVLLTHLAFVSHGRV
jgi:hypothetical protein